MFTALRGAAVAVVAGALLAAAPVSPAAAAPSLAGPTLEEALPVYSTLTQVIKEVVMEPRFLPLLVLK